MIHWLIEWESALKPRRIFIWFGSIERHLNWRRSITIWFPFMFDLMLNSRWFCFSHKICIQNAFAMPKVKCVVKRKTVDLWDGKCEIRNYCVAYWTVRLHNHSLLVCEIVALNETSARNFNDFHRISVQCAWGDECQIKNHKPHQWQFLWAYIENFSDNNTQSERNKQLAMSRWQNSIAES